MDQYVALDVSLKETSVCVLDARAPVRGTSTVRAGQPRRPHPHQGAASGQDRAGHGGDLGRLWHALEAEGPAGRVHGRSTRSCGSLGATDEVRSQRCRG